MLDRIIAESVRIKAEVVSADEKEGDLRRILNFGHTVGHALEAETRYQRFLHGEAVAFGMNAATELASLVGLLDHSSRDSIRKYGLALRTDPEPRRNPAGGSARAPGQRQEDDSRQSAFRAAGTHRSGASDVGRR